MDTLLNAIKAIRLLPILIDSIRSLDEAFRSGNGLPPPKKLPTTWQNLLDEFADKDEPQREEEKKD